MDSYIYEIYFAEIPLGSGLMRWWVSSYIYEIYFAEIPLGSGLMRWWVSSYIYELYFAEILCLGVLSGLWVEPKRTVQELLKVGMSLLCYPPLKTATMRITLTMISLIRRTRMLRPATTHPCPTAQQPL